MPASTFAPEIWHDAVMYLDQYTDFWDLAASPRHLQKFCVGGAQVDQYGNSNNSVIGDFRSPKVRLPGTAGLGNMGSMPKRLLYWVPDHSPRTLVERVDFRSAVGFLDGTRERAALGIGGGPRAGGHPSGGVRLRAAQRAHAAEVTPPRCEPGSGAAATGFEPVVPAEVGITATPTQQQVRLLREVIEPRRPPAASAVGRRADEAAAKGVGATESATSQVR